MKDLIPRLIFCFIVGLILASSLSLASGQVEFSPTILPCGESVINVTYTNCTDWEGLSGVSIDGSVTGVSIPQDTIEIVDGEGDFMIEITELAPDSFTLIIDTLFVGQNPNDCDLTTNQIPVSTDCPSCTNFLVGIDTLQNESCANACDGEATVSPSGGEPPYGFVWENTSGDTIDTSAMVDSLCEGVYIAIVTDDNGCVDTASVTIEAGNSIPEIDPMSDITGCEGDEVFPAITGSDLTGNEAYYDQPNGGGSSYAEGSPIPSSGTYYAYDDNNGCSDEESFTVTLDVTPEIDPVSDITGCEGGEVFPTITGGDLTGNEAYYDQPNGGGSSYTEGSTIPSSGTYYAYDETSNGCSDEESFTVTLDATPDLDSVSNIDGCAGDEDFPNITGTDLTGNEAYYDAPNGEGNSYAAGSTIPSSGIYYVYDETANGCSDEESFTVTLDVTPEIDPVSDITGCEGDEVFPTITGSDLTGNEAYYDQPNGGGSSYAEGSTIPSSDTYYAYDETSNGCSDEESFTVTLDATPDLDSVSNIDGCAGDEDFPNITGTDLTGNEAYYDTPNGEGNSYAPGSTIPSSGIYYVYDETANGCSDQESFTVTLDAIPDIASVSNIAGCVGDEDFPNIIGTDLTGNEAYYDAPNGGGSSYAPGATIPSSGMHYVFDETTNGCFDEESFNVTLDAIPDITPVSNITGCAGDVDFPNITGTDLTGNEAYYDAPNGGGNSYVPGSTISSSGTYYVYDETANGCSDEVSFEVDLNIPKRPTFSFDTEYCVDEPEVELPNSSINGVEGIWNISLISTSSAGTTTYTFSPSSGECATAATVDVTVNPLPDASLESLNGQLMQKSDICQGDTFYWRFTGSNGERPYTFFGTDTLTTQSPNDFILKNIETDTPGKQLFTLSGVEDGNGCYRNLDESIEVEIFQNPEAEIGYFFDGQSNPPTQINDRFSINADRSEYYPPASNFGSYQWSFSPPLINDDMQEIYEFQENSGIFRVNALETNISLEVIDNNGCKNKVVDTLAVRGQDCSLNLSSSETTFCSDQNGQATVNMTFSYTPPDGGNNLSSQTEIIDCDGCSPDPIIEVDEKELSISLKYDNVSSRVVKNIRLKFGDSNNQPNDIICESIEEQEFTLIPKPRISIDNVTYPDADLFCKNGDNMEVHISGIVPKIVQLSYRIISNGVTRYDTISTNDGSLSISLPDSTTGQFDFHLNSLVGLGVSDCETDLSDLESFSFRVEECRKPQLLPLEFSYVDSDTFCLQQGGITIEAFDVNDYREFEGVFEREFNWYLIQNADTINDPSVFRGPKENSVLLYLQSEFVTAGEAEIFCIVENSYGNGVVFSDSVKQNIYIKAEQSPVPRTIYVYPGNVFYLWDTISVADEEYLCIDWGYRSASSNSPTGDTLISDSADIPRISENRYSLFANNWDKLELISNQDVYLWADTWKSENGSCENKAFACLTRNYFNSDLPPAGAPRFGDSEDKNALKVYPNPNYGSLNFILEGHWMGNYELLIFDVSGKLWWQDQFEKVDYQFNRALEHKVLPSGIYFAVLKNENGSQKEQKIVIY